MSSLILDSKPWFTTPEKMKKELIVSPSGNNVKLLCDASGNPPPTVVWYKDGKRLTHVLQDPDPILPHQFTLTLPSVIPDDKGVYTCNVSNAFGYISKTYKVEVAGN